MATREQCLQFEAGPTWCFQVDAESTLCPLDFCPAREYWKTHPDTTAWDALHSHCVMSDRYGTQNDFTVGHGVFVATIARIHKPSDA